MLYFDNAATTKPCEAALHAYHDAAENFWANPSSTHRMGLRSHKKLEEIRGALAQTLSVPDSTLYFTGGATESNAIIISSLLWAPSAGDIIIPKIEHPDVTGWIPLLKYKGWKVTELDAPGGFIDPEQLASSLTDNTRMVCVMSVNNVVGTIEPVAEIVKKVREFEKTHFRHIHIHTDATQAAGKIPLKLKETGVDSASLSAHKFHGLKGAGLLYLTLDSLRSLSRGGEQERGIRPGTENLPALAAMETALQESKRTLPEDYKRVEKLSGMVREVLQKKRDVKIITPKENSSPYILSFTNRRFPSEVLTRILYDKDICISAGSACSNNAKGHHTGILKAMHLTDTEAMNAVRISFSRMNTQEETETLCATLNTILE